MDLARRLEVGLVPQRGEKMADLRDASSIVKSLIDMQRYQTKFFELKENDAPVNF